MGKIAGMWKEFIHHEDGGTTNEYGSVYILLAIALFIIFAAFHGGITATVQTISTEFVNKLDTMSIANSGHQNSM